ncbi:aminodeoxychorismate lyase apoprotein [Plasticicumulans lactativorans]|uniref:Aminodeoxychorismate lyase n=1 Tax=Plasticicumulans lactativorans TaxID=1133106 RepID=A0A4R2L822_9GAMM|nr:aminodeoxychorismate lyase [Plasticicumulans lactativorans]TCO83141.1 aminodeoxychorismate lyase apoprotein [Plasticicumulans lactativorans]
MSMPGVLVDGRPADALAVADRGLQYGDGLFETFAVRDGRPELWTAHLARLARGGERLSLPLPDPGLLAAEAEQLCRGVARGVLKLIVTRGVGGRGYAPPRPCRPTRVLSLHPWPAHPPGHATGGVRVRWCAHPLSLNPRLAGLKHLNRLDQVLARAEWDDPTIAEGLMCDPHGHVVEGTMSNLFVLRDGRLLTPPLDGAGIAGVMREVVLEAARGLGLVVAQAALRPAEVLAADGVGLSNSVIGLWPVRELEGRTWHAVHADLRRLAAAVTVARGA